MSEAHDVEVRKVKKEEHLERVLLDLFPTKEGAKAIRVKNEVEEAAGILYSDDDDDDCEDLSHDMDTLATGNNQNMYIVLSPQTLDVSEYSRRVAIFRSEQRLVCSR